MRRRLIAPAVPAVIPFLLAAGLISALTPAAVHAQTTTTNLLTNPGAETGDLTGWTITSGSPTVDNGTFDSGISPHNGSYDFLGNTGAFGSLSQTVTLVGTQGLTAEQIDSGSAFAGVEFWEQGLSQGDPSDDANVTLTYESASATSLGSDTTPAFDSHSSWGIFIGGYAIPTGTRSIVYTMNFIRNNGTDNDAFMDDNVLIVSTSAPEPSALALLAAVGVPFGAGVVRRRRAASAA